MRADYSINLDRYDNATLKLGQATALLKMIRAAAGSEEFEGMAEFEISDGLYAIITLLEDADELLSDGKVIKGGVRNESSN